MYNSTFPLLLGIIFIIFPSFEGANSVEELFHFLTALEYPLGLDTCTLLEVLRAWSRCSAFFGYF